MEPMPLDTHHCPQDGDSIAEDYVMELLNARDTGIFEEHLLLCEACRARVEDATQFVCAMKQAAAELRGGLS
jgi:hypothetical protein